jgi:hypothetical protein
MDNFSGNEEASCLRHQQTKNPLRAQRERLSMTARPEDFKSNETIVML